MDEKLFIRRFQEKYGSEEDGDSSTVRLAHPTKLEQPAISKLNFFDTMQTLVGVWACRSVIRTLTLISNLHQKRLHASRSNFAQYSPPRGYIQVEECVFVLGSICCSNFYT